MTRRARKSQLSHDRWLVSYADFKKSRRKQLTPSSPPFARLAFLPTLAVSPKARPPNPKAQTNPQSR